MLPPREAIQFVKRSHRFGRHHHPGIKLPDVIYTFLFHSLGVYTKLYLMIFAPSILHVIIIHNYSIITNNYLIINRLIKNNLASKMLVPMLH
jgi:hypothetical protein